MCPKCGTTEREVRKNLRFGCSECYHTFADIVEQTYKQMRGKPYTGRTPLDTKVESAGEAAEKPKEKVKPVDEAAELSRQIDEAVTMLSTSRGNCYNYAAAFWALARGLGYDATAVAGTVGWDHDPHGWVIMYDAEGERITYDVELEMAYRYQRGRYDVDMYAMGSWKANQWNYIYGEQFG